MKNPAFLYTLLFIPLAILGFTACEDDGEVAYAGGNTFGYQGQAGPNSAPQYGAPYGQGTPPSGSQASDSRPVAPNSTATADAPKKPKGPSRDSTASSTTTSSSTATTSTPSTGPAGTPTYPNGIPVPNKPGFVMSPYTKPDQGYVDVRGYPPGMEVKDPYTGGVFLVP